MGGGHRWPAAVGVMGVLWMALPGTLDARSTETEIARRRSELSVLKRQIDSERQQAQALKGRESQMLSELERIDRQVNAVERYLTKLAEQEEAFGKRLTELAEEISTRELELEASRARLNARIRQLYKDGRPTLVEIVFGAESLPDVMRRIDMNHRLADEETKLMGSIRQAQDELLAAQREVEKSRFEIQLIQEEKDSEHQELVTLKEERQRRLGEIKSQRASREQAIVELRAAGKALEELIETLESQIAAEGEDFVPLAGPFAEARGKLPWPVRGKVIASFGKHTNPDGTATRNNGLDIRAAAGQPVRAVAAGKVAFRDWLTGYGNCVLLNHGGGYYTFYAHASEVLVTVGQTVESGDVIARVGDTGSLKGTALHFEVRQGAKALNPHKWLQ